MYARVHVQDLIDQQGNLPEGFQLKKFLDLFDEIVAVTNTWVGVRGEPELVQFEERQLLRRKPGKSFSELEIWYCDEDYTTFSMVELSLLKAGLKITKHEKTTTRIGMAQNRPAKRKAAKA